MSWPEALVYMAPIIAIVGIRAYVEHLDHKEEMRRIELEAHHNKQPDTTRK